MKRVLALLLTLALLCCCAPFAYAEPAVEDVLPLPAAPIEAVAALQGEVASGSCGTAVTWSLDDAFTLTISGSGAMRNYGYSYGGGAPWSSYKSSIQSVVIGSGVTGVGNEAFADCTALAHVTLPDGLTRIGYGAFSGCSALKEISFPDSLTSVGCYAFFYSGLSYTAYENAKYLGSSANPYVVLIEAESTAVTSFRVHAGTKCIADNAFAKCAELKSVTIADGVAGIGAEAFSGCSALTRLTLPGSLTRIGSDAFSGCEKLTWTYYTGDLAAWCGIAFENAAANPLYAARAKNLNVGGNWIAGNLAIPDGVTRVGAYAFLGCDRLTSVCFPGSVTQIGSGAFADCLNLTDVHYAGTQEQWESVDRGSEAENEALFFALLHENSTGPRTAIPGDVNRDNIVNAKDITLIRRHLAGGYGVELG